MESKAIGLRTYAYRFDLIAGTSLLVTPALSLALLFWFATPDRFNFEIGVMLPRPDCPPQQCNIGKNLLPGPAGDHVGDKQNVSLNVGLQGRLTIYPYLLQSLIPRPRANRSLPESYLVSNLAGGQCVSETM